MLRHVYDALTKRDTIPWGKLGYLSGFPFITSHKNARTLITAIERDIILEELITVYLQS